MGNVGLIVNPVAGIGGRVGLKGSDGAEIQAQARALGAVPQAQARAALALEKLRAVDGLEIVTCPGEMGEDAARAAGMTPTVIGAITPGQTTAQDTVAAAREMQRLGVDLLLFAGGDGTARDIYHAVGLTLPVLGIPAGVKIHSAVYATSPASAGTLAALYLQGQVSHLREAEVMDIDEEAVRQGVISPQLHGYLRIPFRANLVQSLKVARSGEQAALAEIAADVIEGMVPGWLYILGPGTTVRAIAEELGLPKTLIGVDVVEGSGESLRSVSWEQGSRESLGSGSEGQAAADQKMRAELVAADANEGRLLELLSGRQARIVVTLIGGQGYLFGRGNQQISPRVIERVGKENILVVCTPDKLHALGTQPLRVDTGDPAVDAMLSGYIMVITGYRERAVRRVVG